MCKRSILLVSLCLVLGLTSVAPAKLVAHWKLDDGSGTVASDSSGNGFNGTLIGGPTWTVGMDGMGGGLDFDGVNDYVDFGNPAGWPSGKSPRSLCGWGKTNTVASGYRWIAAYGSEGTGLAMFIGMNGSTLYVGGYGDDLSCGQCLAGGRMVPRGRDLRWIDRQSLRQRPRSRKHGERIGTLVLGRAHIGRQVNNYAEFWNGAVDDVRLYDHALKAAEVKALSRRK